MNGKQIAQLKQTLLDKQAQLRDLQYKGAEARAPVSLDQQSVGRVSRIDAIQHQAMAQAQTRHRAAELARIERALAQIESNDYGYCADCDEEIAFKRLAVDPAAALCIRCAARES